MKRKKRIIALLFTAAVAVVLCPYAANFCSSAIQKKAIAAYEENISGLDPGVYEACYEEALAWNEALASGSVSSAIGEETTFAAAYESLLNLTGDGMMGSIEIPKIGVDLPVYHYTTDQVLDKGIGHMEETALPVGGAGTRCVLTGHCGLPGSRLFTYLDELEEGDIFYLHILGETLAYEVTEIEVIEPEDTEALAAEPGEDLCTLMTCTPYGVNSHRLLVTGRRTEAAEDEAQEKSVAFWEDYVLLAAAAAETMIFLVVRRRMNTHLKKGSEDN